MAHEDNNGGVNPSNAREATKRGGCLDKLWLVATAVAVIIIFGSAYWFTITHNWSPLWVFFTANSVGLGFVLAKYFKAELDRPYFKLVLAIWAIAHGGLAATLSRMRVSGAMWLLFFMAELLIGYLITIRLFNIRGRRSASNR